MNIEKLKIKPTAILEVKNPISGDFEGATIELFNRYSDEYKTAVLLLSNNPSISFVERQMEILVSITKEIKGFKSGKKEIESTKENIKMIYENLPFLIDEVDTFFSNLDNFFLNK